MIKQGTDILKQHNKKRLTFNGELKRIDFLDRRVYKRSDGVYYPSVTTILQYMPKNHFFENWLKDVGHNADLIRNKAGKEGVSWMDNYGKAKYSQIVWEMILKFHEFWTLAKPKLISTEEFVFSDEYQYAGTADLLVEMEGKTILIDIKTSNALHKTYHLQLAAYAKAIEEKKGIKVDGTSILWLKSYTKGHSKKKGVWQGKGWQLKEINEIHKNFDLFMTIYKLYNLENPTVEPIYNSYPTTLKIDKDAD
jgi:hypothetical protein